MSIRLTQWGQILFSFLSLRVFTDYLLNTQKSKLKKLIIELRVHNTCNAHKEIISLPFGRSGMCKISVSN